MFRVVLLSAFALLLPLAFSQTKKEVDVRRDNQVFFDEEHMDVDHEVHALPVPRIAILVEDLYDDHTLWGPYYRLSEIALVHLVSPAEGRQQVFSSALGDTTPTDAALDDSFRNSDLWDAVIIPSGYSADKLRMRRSVNVFVRSMAKEGKLVAWIGHGAWVPLSAGLLDGRNCTSTPSIRGDVANAGATWMNSPVVWDKNFISSRDRSDLPLFSRAIVQALSHTQGGKFFEGMRYRASLASPGQVFQFAPPPNVVYAESPEDVIYANPPDVIYAEAPHPRVIYSH